MVMNKKIFKFFLILTIFLGYMENSFSIEPKEFIQSTVNEASAALNISFSKEEKIKKLKIIAKEAVDIRGIGFYSLGAHRKNLSDKQKNEYSRLFEQYFLKSFSSRLAKYTDPKIKVYSQEKLNKNYTIVSSILIATEKRPEVKIDWRVYTKNTEKLLIRDLIIEGLSLARTQKEEFNSIIQSNEGNINALFLNLTEFINK
jgi:phospholipid transport system substrate-binding protein